MRIRAVPTRLEPVLVVEADFVSDERGFFFESYHRRHFAECGIDCEFVQDNHSRSRGGVLRGIHYQDLRAPMAKLVRCTLGRVHDVVVDLRVGSRTFGQWIGVELSAENMKQVFIPVGFGHAFLTLSDAAEVQYKCTNYYAPLTEAVIAWNDPDIGIAWPITAHQASDGAKEGIASAEPVLSERDRRGMSLRAYLRDPAFCAAQPVEPPTLPDYTVSSSPSPFSGAPSRRI